MSDRLFCPKWNLLLVEKVTRFCIDIRKDIIRVVFLALSISSCFMSSRQVFSKVKPIKCANSEMWKEW